MPARNGHGVHAVIELSALKAILGSGADVAIIALLAVMWRFDRRIIRLETLIINGSAKKKEPKKAP